MVTFTITEISAAIENYRAQEVAVQKQLENLGAQIQQLQTTAHMIRGAIIAFESLIKEPVQAVPEPPPPAETPSE